MIISCRDVYTSCDYFMCGVRTISKPPLSHQQNRKWFHPTHLNQTPKLNHPIPKIGMVPTHSYLSLQSNTPLRTWTTIVIVRGPTDTPLNSSGTCNALHSTSGDPAFSSLKNRTLSMQRPETEGFRVFTKKKKVFTLRQHHR